MKAAQVKRSLNFVRPEAYARGRACGATTEGRMKHNPYRRWSVAWKAWLRGFRDARAAA